MSALDAVRGFVRRAWVRHDGRTLTPWIAGYALVCTLYVLVRLGTPPYDDAHFFKRIGWNGVTHGVLAWNVDEGPVQGVTSQLYALVYLPIVALAPAHSMFVARVFALVCLVLCFAILRSVTEPHDRGVAATLACLAPALLHALLSGMETALCLLVVSVALATAMKPAKHWTIGPLLVVAVYLARPDAALLVLPLVFFIRPVANPRTFVAELLFLAGLLGAVLVVLRSYYGTALPLPFYAKQSLLSPYDAEFVTLARSTSYARLGEFALVAVPLLFLSLARRDRQNLVLVGSAVGFVAYHFCFTIDVMGMHGRFYVPAQPLLAVSAARGLELLVRRVGTLARAQDPMAALLIAVVGGSSASRLNVEKLRMSSDEEYLHRQTETTTVHRVLDTLRACFGDRLHAYHSEIGLIGLRLPSGKVSDLAGLMSEQWAFRAPGSFDVLCELDRPEAIFLPHKNYAALNREIKASRCLTRYEEVVAQSSSPLYVRRDLLTRFRACAEKRHDEFVVSVRERRE